MDKTKPPLAGAAAPTRAPITGKQAAGVGAGLAGTAALALVLAVAGLKPDEGKRNVDYLDLARVPTACYGHTGPDVVVGTRRTDAACETLLSADARAKQAGVARCIPALTTRPYQWAAYTRIAFNAGVPAICGSTSARLANAGRWREACDAFRPWNKARVGGKLTVIPGLAARRERERAQCLTGLA